LLGVCERVLRRESSVFLSLSLLILARERVCGGGGGGGYVGASGDAEDGVLPSLPLSAPTAAAAALQQPRHPERPSFRRF
jgi:hypothetical protein